MSDNTITASPMLHENQERIRVDIPYDPALIQMIRTVSGARWSAQTRPAGHSGRIPAKYQEAVTALEQCLTLKRYSWRTVKGYKNCFRQFIWHYNDIKPSQITRKQIDDYILGLIKEKHITESCHNIKRQSVKKIINILPLCLLLASQSLFGQTKFSEQQLRDDLLFYKLNLERYHPNLYLYNSKDNFNHFFDSLINSITEPLIEADFYRKITLSSGLIKDGHTLILPSNSFLEYHNLNSKFLPLQIGIHKEQLYVKMNCTPSILVEDGTIIDSINGVSSNEIIKELIARQVRDGNNISYANWILDTYFREYYSYTFGHPEVYEISYAKDNGVYNVKSPALFKDSIYQYRRSNYPKIFSNNKQSKGVYLEYDSSQNIAILTINDFHSDILKSEFNQNFSKEINSIFESIFLANPQGLVIDLRNNQGGDVENGVKLLRYLITQPFKIVNEYNRLKSRKLVRCKGPSSGFHRPYGKTFIGQVYVLLNGGSFSNSVIFSSCLKEYTNAIFVGTRTGGNPNVLAGYTKDFELPNTKIRVEIPTKQFIMTDLKRNDGNGLIPNYEIDNSIQDIIRQNDRQLNFVLMLIKENEK